MQEITQCTFGQAWKEAEAFNTEHAEIVHSRHTVDANKSNIYSYVQYNKFKVSSTTLKDSLDFENFCRIFDITPNTLLKTLANGKIKMDKLWNFIFDNVNGACFCISVFDMSSKAHVYSKKKLNETEKQIIDFHFGRHFLFLIPVVNNVKIPDNEEIENLLQNREIKYSNIFESAGKILINYEEELECSKICKFLPNLFEIAEKFKLICVSISILKNDEEEKLNVEPEILTILAAKKLFHIIEKKFPNEVDFHQNYDNLQTAVSVDELLVLSQNIVAKLEVVKKCLNAKNPPRIIKGIYLDLKVFHNRFLNVIYENPSTKITINSEIFEVLQEVCEGLLATPFVKHDGSWVLKVDDENAEAVNSFTTNKYCIVFNAATKKYLKQLYSDTNGDYYHVITTRQKMKNLQEPMLYAHDNNLYPIGTVDNDTNAGETTATKLHVSECNCKGSKKNKKVWMCVACKRFLFETLENNEWLKCNCGFHIISKLDKRCVCCSVKRKISRVVPITLTKTRTVPIRMKSSIKTTPSLIISQNESDIRQSDTLKFPVDCKDDEECIMDLNNLKEESQEESAQPFEEKNLQDWPVNGNVTVKEK